MNREQVDLSYFAAHPEVCHPQAGALQKSVALETIKSRGFRAFRQYGLYFAGMWAYGLVSSARGSIIRSGYFWLRHIDDVADGDKPLPSGYEDRQQFLQRKRSLAEQLFFHSEATVYGDREDILLADYYSTSRKLGISLGNESLAILDTIILDEERARNRRVLTQEELDEYFEKLDFACGEGALKVAGENCDSKDLSALSWAVRTMFNLRDFPRDLAQGIINISAEEMADYGVDLSQIDGVANVEDVVIYEPIRRWYQDQVPQGLGFLQESRRVLRELDLKPLTSFALNTFFVRPVDKTLSQYKAMLFT